MKCLVVEDDKQIQSYIKKGLKEAGHSVDVASDGEDGLYMATHESYDVLIIDRMLPKRDGLSLIQELRGQGLSTSVLILSALSDVDARVEGLRAGGDDYLTKPFAFVELLARVEVLAKRGPHTHSQTSQQLTAQDLKLNLLSRMAHRSNLEIELQPREFKLLEYLLKFKGQLVTRTMLLEAVWNYHFDPQTSVIDVHISRLRKKLHDHDATLIRTIRGAGYIIEDSH